MASQKFGFVTVDPVSGSGDQAVNFSGDKHTGRLQRTINLMVTSNGGAKKALVVNQEAAAEMVRSDSPNASVQKTGGNVTITGKSNSTKLLFAVASAEENGLALLLPANYTAAGKTTANGAVIADDPGRTGQRHARGTDSYIEGNCRWWPGSQRDGNASRWRLYYRD
mgnify:CR=1 FL=1